MLEHPSQAVVLDSWSYWALVQVYSSSTLFFQPRTVPASSCPVYWCYLLLHKQTEFNNDNLHTTRATSSDLAAAISDSECSLHQGMSDVGAKFGSFDITLMEPVSIAWKEVTPSRMERLLAVHTVNNAAEDMAGTVIKSCSDDTKHNLQQALKSFKVVFWHEKPDQAYLGLFQVHKASLR